jgi:hypothetical protein
MTDVSCPICGGGILSRSEGKLEQSGDSYLPTVVWTCPRCEYSRYEAATRAHWRSAVPAPEPELAPRRAA